MHLIAYKVIFLHPIFHLLLGYVLFESLIQFQIIKQTNVQSPASLSDVVFTSAHVHNKVREMVSCPAALLDILASQCVAQGHLVKADAWQHRA